MGAVHSVWPPAPLRWRQQQLRLLPQRQTLLIQELANPQPRPHLKLWSLRRTRLLRARAHRHPALGRASPAQRELTHRHFAGMQEMRSMLATTSSDLFEQFAKDRQPLALLAA